MTGSVWVILPAHLRAMAQVDGEVHLEVAGGGHAALGAGRPGGAVPGAGRDDPRPDDAATPSVRPLLRVPGGPLPRERPTHPCRPGRARVRSRSWSSARWQVGDADARTQGGAPPLPAGRARGAALEARRARRSTTSAARWCRPARTCSASSSTSRASRRGTWATRSATVRPSPSPGSRTTPSRTPTCGPRRTRRVRRWSACTAGCGSTPTSPSRRWTWTGTGHVPWWPEEHSAVTLHQILVHMIAETHRHAGHADIVRELVDGAVGTAHGQHQHVARRRRRLGRPPETAPGGRGDLPSGRRLSAWTMHACSVMTTRRWVASARSRTASPAPARRSRTDGRLSTRPRCSRTSGLR